MAAYVITGGSGGLGLLFAGWMVQCGARCVVLLGRSGRVAAAADLHALAAGPARVVVLRADVACGEEAAVAAVAAAAVNRRLAGVIHAAGVQVRPAFLWHGDVDASLLIYCASQVSWHNPFFHQSLAMREACIGCDGEVLKASAVQVEARLMKQGPQTMRQVMAPKAGAVQNFGTCAAAAPLDFSLLCSSVSAVAGYSGQV